MQYGYAYCTLRLSRIASSHVAQRRRGAGLLNAPEEAIEAMVADDELTEVSYGDED